MKDIKKLIIQKGNNEYELVCGEGGQPAPNSVGTDEIIDDSVKFEDINTEVKDSMITAEDRVSKEDLDKFNV